MAVSDGAMDRVEVRDGLAAAVREAGALALQTFRGQLKSWIKGKSSPVSEADLAVDALQPEGMPHPQRIQSRKIRRQVIEHASDSR